MFPFQVFREFQPTLAGGFKNLGQVIRSLFVNGEQGVWYDPSDLSTLYQDAAGTTPVTAVEQPVGLMLDKSQGLVLGPELVTNGDFSNGLTGWHPGTTNSTLSLVDGEAKSTRIASPSADARFFAYNLSVVGGRRYQVAFDAYSANYAGPIRVGISTLPVTPSPLSASVSIGTTKTRRVCIVEAAASAIALEFSGGSGVVVQIGDELVIDNISVRELPGNHAYQTTATSRPVLSARVNLLTKTEQFEDAVWTKLRSSIQTNVVIAPDGTLTADKFVEDTSYNTHHVSGPSVSITAATACTGSIYIKQSDLNRQAHIFLANANATSGVRVGVDLTNGAVIFAAIGGASNASAKITPVGNDWYYVSVTGIIDSSSTAARLYIYSTDNVTTGLSFYTGDGYSGIYIWGADLRVANDGANLPPYQRVNTATDYDTVGFPHYLRFDGVDDWLVTNTITPGTDKVQLFAGVRKLSDAALGIIVELSADLNTNVGTFYLLGPNSTGTSTYMGANKGTINRTAFVTGYAAPITNVLTHHGDISGDAVSLRINGVQAAQSTADQGTGNYLAYPLYIGRRGGTTFPFNGRLYSLIVRFGSNLPTATIQKTEKYINQKTRAY